MVLLPGETCNSFFSARCSLHVFPFNSASVPVNVVLECIPERFTLKRVKVSSRFVFIQLCFVFNPHRKRMSIEEALNHPWIKV